MSSEVMQESDWAGIVAGIRARWPHADLPDSTISVWFEAVKDLPADQVMAAVETYYRDGREFPPHGGMLRQRVVELRHDAPTWGVVWKHVKKAQMKAPAYRDDHDGRRPYLEANGLTIAANWLDAIGWPSPDEWSDDNLESRLRRKWEEWLRDHLSGETYRGLPPAGLARLERGDGPRKLPAGAVADAIAPSRALPPAGGSDGPTARYGLTVIDGGQPGPHFIS